MPGEADGKNAFSGRWSPSAALKWSMSSCTASLLRACTGPSHAGFGGIRRAWAMERGGA